MRRNVFNISFRLSSLLGSLTIVMILTVILGVAGYLCSTFLTIFGVRAMLEILNTSAKNGLDVLFSLIIACAVLRGFLRYAEQLGGHYLAFKILAILRDRLFKALRRLSPAKLENKDKGSLIALITSDIELLEVFYAHTIAPVAIAVITSAIMSVFIGAVHPLLGVISVLGYIVVGVAIPVINSKKGRNTGALYRENYGEMNSYFLESLRGMKESIQYEQEENRLKVIENMTNALDESQKRLKEHEGYAKSVTDMAVYIFSLAVLFAGIYMMKDGIVNFEGVVISAVAMFSSFGPVIALSSLSNSLVQTFASADRMFDILDEEPETPEITKGINVEYGGADYQDVVFSYGDKKILDGINLSIDNNKILGIKGRSGSGKSTMLKLLMRFWDRDSGSIKISDTDIKNINTENLRDMESYMTQDTFLFNDTIEENIKIGKLNASRGEVEAAAKQASVHDFIMTLPQDYLTKVGELGDRLSEGEKQRIGLARAFIHDSPLLILDEPTSNLDSLNEAIILKTLKENSDGKTVMLVSHRNAPMKIADEVFNLNTVNGA